MKNFNEFLLESKGISDICLKYNQTIFNDIKKDIEKFYNNNINNKLAIYKNTYQYSFNDEFKIDDLYITLNLYRYNNNYCNVTTDFNKTILDNDILKYISMDFKIYINKLSKNFWIYIGSTILHELVHCYEQYQLRKNKKFRPKSWSIGTIYPELRKKYKNNDIQNILDLLYKSLKHEISSQLHQYYYHKINNENYNHINDIINDLNNFKIDNINDNFINELENIRQHIYNSIKYKSIHKFYLKDLNKDIWSNQINKLNINEFINNLNELFKESSKYIIKKIKLIDRKLNEIYYDDGEELKLFENSF